jgi:hypothetical protein
MATFGLIQPEKSVAAQRSAVFWVILSVLLSIPVHLHPYPFFTDDALFYPQVAYNIVAGKGITFNGGITRTNGFHPLWMLFNVAALALGHNNKIVGLAVILSIETGIMAWAVVLYRRLIRSIGLGSNVGLALLVAIGSGGLWLFESHLSAALILLCTLTLTGDQATTRVNTVHLGLLLGLLFLARLDNVFLVVPILLLSARGLAPRAMIFQIMTVGSVAVALVAPYLLFNRASYGHFTPVSGAIKSTFPIVMGRLDSLGPFGILVFAVAVIGLISAITDMLPKKARSAVAALSVGAILQSSYVILFTDHPGTAVYWYYIVGCVDCLLLVDVVIARLAIKHGLFVSKATGAVAFTIVLLGAARNWGKFAGLSVNPFNYSVVTRTATAQGVVWQEQITQWIDNYCPENSRIFVYDFPGFFAYTSKAAIVPADGLINDYAFNDDLLAQGISGYITKKRLEFYVGPIAEVGESPIRSLSLETYWQQRGQTVRVIDPLYRLYVGEIELPDSQLVVKVRSFCPSCPNLGVWRLSPRKAVESAWLSEPPL